MGAAISAHVEISIGGQWHYYGQLDLLRDQAVFDHLRGREVTDDLTEEDLEALHEVMPRGFDLPTDTTAVTRLFYEARPDDTHDPCWLDAAKLQALVRYAYHHSGETKLALQDFFSVSWLEWAETSDGVPDAIEDVRLICWFDSV